MKLTVRFPDAIHAALSERARLERRSLNQVVVQAVEAALGEREPQAGQDAFASPASAVLRELPSRSPSAAPPVATRVRDVAPPLKPFTTDFKTKR